MIISKKKFDEKVLEKVHEALDRAERDRWIHERIESVDRESCRRFEDLQRHCFELERKIAFLLDEKSQLKGE